MGDGQSRQHGGDAQDSVAWISIYIPGGQRTVRDELEVDDWRPSGNTTRILHTDCGGPSRPAGTGSHRTCMSVSVTETNWAGCEKEETPDAAGRNVHDALVMLVVVNIGMKKLVAGSMGTQSMPTVLPINDTMGDEKARMTGEKSSTVTA